jgi:hypothetical protein
VTAKKQHGIEQFLELDGIGDPTNGHGGISFLKRDIAESSQAHIERSKRKTIDELKAEYLQEAGKFLKRLINVFGKLKQKYYLSDVQETDDEYLSGAESEDLFQPDVEESKSSKSEDRGEFDKFVSELHTQGTADAPTHPTEPAGRNSLFRISEKRTVLKRTIRSLELDGRVIVKTEYSTDEQEIKKCKNDKFE